MKENLCDVTSQVLDDDIGFTLLAFCNLYCKVRNNTKLQYLPLG